MNIESRPWTLQDLLDNLQKMIVGEPDDYCNERRWTLCTARDYLKQYFMQPDEPLVMEDFTIVGESVDRLAAYEDTGLDPEEIEQLKRERDKLERFLGELEGTVYTGLYFHLRPMIEKWHGQKEER